MARLSGRWASCAGEGQDLVVCCTGAEGAVLRSGRWQWNPQGVTLQLWLFGQSPLTLTILVVIEKLWTRQTLGERTKVPGESE